MRHKVNRKKSKINKKFALLIMFLLAVFCLISCGKKADAAEKKSKSKPSYIGTLEVTDDDGNIKGIILNTEDGKKYIVTVDSKSMQMAKNAGDATVQIKGKVTTKKLKDGETQLKMKIKSYTVIYKGTLNAEYKGKKLISLSIGDMKVQIDKKSTQMAAKAKGKQVIATGSRVSKATKDDEEEEILIIKKCKVVE
ncbi:MAG: hypothetical protein ACYTFY_10275 [Planctomycetota bacterium]|jgi:hypothetical protein